MGAGSGEAVESSITKKFQETTKYNQLHQHVHVPFRNHFTTGDASSSGYCPPPPASGSQVVMYRVRFKNGRQQLFQGLALLQGQDGCAHELAGLVGAGTVISSESSDAFESGEEYVQVLSVKECSLTPGMKMIPYMPVLRLATWEDEQLVLLRVQQESLILSKCKEIWCKLVLSLISTAERRGNYEDGKHYAAARLQNVELQLDCRRMVIKFQAGTFIPYKRIVEKIKSVIRIVCSLNNSFKIFLLFLQAGDLQVAAQ